jgi:hypothetical protein
MIDYISYTGSARSRVYYVKPINQTSIGQEQFVLETERYENGNTRVLKATNRFADQ